MASASVTVSSINESQPISEIMLDNFADKFNRTQDYYENHNITSTSSSGPPAITTTMRPDIALSRLAQIIFTMSTTTINSMDNVTSYPLLTEMTNETFAATTTIDAIALEHAPQFTHTTMIKVCVLAVMAVFSMLGNIFTMWNIYKTRFKRRSMRNSWNAIYSLLFHLSIADLLVTAFCIIGDAAWAYTVQWRGGDMLCKLVKLFQMFSLYLSTYVMVLIGVDRWFAVKFPMRSLYMTKRCYQFLGIVYMASFILSVPQFFIFHLSRGPFVEEFHQCVTHGTYTAPWQEKSYTTFTLFSTFVIPLAILTVTYVSTFRAISESEKMFLGPQQDAHASANLMHTNRQRLIHRAKVNSFRLSFVIIIAFLICWLPYCTLMVLFQFVNIDEVTSRRLIDVIFFFGMSNSLVNPLIYGAFHLNGFERKTSDKGGGNSLNRADSQRNPSVLTALTQVDGYGRSTRNSRKASYYRTQHSLNNSKEQASLLQMSPATAIVHKFNSSQVKSERNSLGSSPQTQSENCEPDPFEQCGNSCGGGGDGVGVGVGEAATIKRDANTHNAVVYNYKNSKSTILHANTLEDLENSLGNRMQTSKVNAAVAPVSENGFHRSVCVLSIEGCKICTDEDVSNV